MSVIEMLDRGDVYIEDIEPPKCDNCVTGNATKRIRLDLRDLGLTVLVGHAYCDKCSSTIANQLKATLPPENNNG
jgi:hypothetical protein